MHKIGFTTMIPLYHLAQIALLFCYLSDLNTPHAISFLQDQNKIKKHSVISNPRSYLMSPANEMAKKENEEDHTGADKTLIEWQV